MTSNSPPAGGTSTATPFYFTGGTVPRNAACYVVLLTNRVHPSRDGDGIKQVRPAFHDAVMEALGSV